LVGRTFALIVVDRDAGEFGLEGPMDDDRPCNKAVVDAQKVGRNIRCFAMGARHGCRRVAERTWRPSRCRRVDRDATMTAWTLTSKRRRNQLMDHTLRVSFTRRQASVLEPRATPRLPPRMSIIDPPIVISVERRT
jgi:hypothetical protein